MKNYFKDWSKFELSWLIVACLLVVSVSISFGDSLLVLTSSLAGVISVILCAKGKVSYLYIGMYQCLTYSYIAYNHEIYGEFMLNLFFVIPTNIITLILWKRAKNRKENATNGEDVVTKKLTLKQWFILIPIVSISILAYSYYLTSIEARQVHLDSFAVILTVVAQFLLMFRYVEQWIFWIIINIITVSIWVIVMIQDGTGSIGILVMWLLFLGNSIYGYINWTKITKSNEV